MTVQIKKGKCLKCGKEFIYKFNGKHRKFCNQRCYLKLVKKEGPMKKIIDKNGVNNVYNLALASVLMSLYLLKVFFPKILNWIWWGVVYVTTYTIKISINPAVWLSIFGWEAYKYYKNR